MALGPEAVWFRRGLVPENFYTEQVMIDCPRLVPLHLASNRKICMLITCAPSNRMKLLVYRAIIRSFKARARARARARAVLPTGDASAVTTIEATEALASVKISTTKPS